MKGSQELIEYFDMREKALGEKATEFNMFLEGYAEGHKDTKEFQIDKACEWLSEHAFSWIDDNKVNEDTRKLKQQKIKELQDDFRKAMEE